MNNKTTISSIAQVPDHPGGVDTQWYRIIKSSTGTSGFGKPMFVEQ